MKKFSNKNDAINSRTKILEKITALLKIDKEDEGVWLLHYPDFLGGMFEFLPEEISPKKIESKIELSNKHFCISCGNPLPVERVKLLGEKIRCIACQKRTESPPISSPKNNPNHAATTCTVCGSKLKLYKGPFGPFYNCSNFPHCPGKS